MDKDNLRILEGKSTPSITKEALRKLRDELPMMIEYFGIHAEMAKAKFEALKNQGFSEAQALELCKSLF